MGACTPERQHLAGHVSDRGICGAVEGVGDVGAFRALHQPGFYVRPINPKERVQQVINDCNDTQDTCSAGHQRLQRHTRDVFSRSSTSALSPRNCVQQVINDCNSTRNGRQVPETRLL